MNGFNFQELKMYFWQQMLWNKILDYRYILESDIKQLLRIKVILKHIIIIIILFYLVTMLQSKFGCN